jgi:ABC-type bacteriocin/lantibiotic exporter with double-glycine peptidase domain
MHVLGKLLFKYKGYVVLTVFLSILSTATALWWNVVLSEMINIVSIEQSPSQVQMITALSIMLVLGAVSYYKAYFAGLSCEKMSHGLRMGYARYISSLPIKVISDMNVGDQISKLQNEMVGITDYLHTKLFLLIDDTVKFGLTFIGLLIINPKLTFQANVPSFILVGYIFWSSRIIGTAADHSQSAKGRMNQYADVLLTLFPVIYLYNGAHMVLYSYEKEVNSWEQHTFSLERTKAWLMSLSGLLSILPMLLLIFIGGNMVIHSELTIGYLYIFLNLSGNVSGVLMNMPGHIAAFRQFLTNLKHMESHVIIS